jgi:hypothetical protein
MFSVGLERAFEIEFVLGKAANPFHSLAALQKLAHYDRFSVSRIGCIDQAKFW